MNGLIDEALCATCARAGGCTLPNSMEEPILSCDLFESLDDVMPVRVKEAASSDPSRMEGLCVDCDNRSSCVFRQPEGGTWHCEEYC